MVITTYDSATPTASWLRYTVTGKARAKIRQFLKQQQRGDVIDLGKRLLDRAIKTRRFGRKRLIDDRKNALLDSLGVESWDHLLNDIGLGKRMPSMVARQLLPSARKSIGDSGQSHMPDEPLAIHGAEGMLVNYARCCGAVPGDTIVGFVTAGRGVVVHTADCPNTAEYRKHPDKWVHVYWAEDVHGEFAVMLRFDAQNKRGVLAGIANRYRGTGFRYQ